MKKMSKASILGIIGLLILMLLSFGLVLLFNEKDNDPTNPSVDTDISTDNQDDSDDPTNNRAINQVLADHNRYFTIDDAIGRFFTYSAARNANGMFMLLLDDYLSSESIELENVLTRIPYENGKIYSTYQIRYTELSERIIRYDVKGYLTETAFEEAGEKTSFDTTVYFDTENMTYAIALEANYLDNVSGINDNSYNTYSIKNVSDSSIAMLYFADLKDNIMRKTDNLKDIINNYSNFDINNHNYNAGITSYRFNNLDRTSLTIVDTNNVSYSFEIKGVLNYTVTIS